MQQEKTIRYTLHEDWRTKAIVPKAIEEKLEELLESAYAPYSNYPVSSVKEKFVLSISENGFGKKTSHNDYRVTNRGGKGIIGIVNSPRNGNITSSFPVFEGDEILISTNKGRVIRVAVKEIRTAGRNTQGVRIIKLSGEEKVVSAIKIDDNLI